MAIWDNDPVLKVEHLTMRFGGLTAVSDLTFNAARKQITALIGPNGAGKTTVFNCITGFYKPTEGMVQLRHPDGKEFLLERMDDYIIAQKAKVARTFQNIRLFSGMTVLENLMVAQHNTLMTASGYTVAGVLGSGHFRRAEQEAIELCKFWLEKTKLIDRADDPAGDLPYGDQRRLEIARAMCTKPILLCLDEPAAGLNPRESEDLNALLRAIRSEHDMAILLIEHDMSVVMKISDHVVVLDYGLKISDGDPAHVKSDPAVIRAYLGVDEEEAETEAPEIIAEALHLAPPVKKAPAKKSVVKKAVARKAAGKKPAASEEEERPHMSEMLLQARGVQTFYGKIQALKGVDVDIPKGKIVTLIGSNGAGKSTLMMTIFGTPRARAGTITFEGRDITQLPPHEIARLGLSQSPEGRRIFPRMTVLENLQMGATVNHGAHMQEDLAKAFAMFPILEKRQNQRGGTLSGGEQQMLAIARALMARPKLLLLDEPSLGLAPLIVKQIFEAIKTLNQTQGLTVFLVEQNAFHALKLAHQAYVMVNGLITMSGTGKELLARPEIRAAYLEGGH